jgi:hypothetical protein
MICSVEQCSRDSKYNGLCGPHYFRNRRYGDPLKGSTYRGDPLAFLERALASDSDGCILWPFNKDHAGYARGSVHVNIPRYICEQINGPAPSLIHQAAHSCGNGHLGCISWRHLSWKTPKENSADRYEHGTHIVAIRAIKNRSQASIAKQFGISQSLVSDIRSNKRWSHVAYDTRGVATTVRACEALAEGREGVSSAPPGQAASIVYDFTKGEAS